MHANLEIQNCNAYSICFIKSIDSPSKSLYIQKQQFPEFLNISNIFNLGIQDSEHAITKKNCKPFCLQWFQDEAIAHLLVRNQMTSKQPHFSLRPHVFRLEHLHLLAALCRRFFHHDVTKLWTCGFNSSVCTAVSILQDLVLHSKVTTTDGE